jgi:cobalt-zinc-cadmium efflux system protein
MLNNNSDNELQPCRLEQENETNASCEADNRDHHHHHHGHGHHHLSAEPSREELHRLRQVFGLTVLYLVAELVGGYLSGSLALLADGFHMFADAAGIGIALLAQSYLHRPAPAYRTFGYQRLEVLAALLNALSLLAMSAFILWESVERFQHPLAVQSSLMLPIAVGGFLINLVSLKLLHGGHHHNLNVKGAYLHVMSDLMGSLAAIVAGILIACFHWYLADPILSAGIAILIVVNAIGLLKDAINILLEGCPSHIDIDEVRSAMLAFDEILEVHHLHVWTINLQRIVLTAHLVVTPESFGGELINKVQRELKQTFGLSHVTLQIETS